MIGTKLAVSVFVARGADKGKTYSFKGQKVSIGRDLANDVSIVDEEVSRWHCTISQDDGRLFVDDLKSSNGTFVNDSPITRQILNPGDVVRVGQTHLVVGTDLDRLPDAPRVAHETNYVDQEALDTCVMPLNGPATVDSESSDDLFEDAGRRFVRIQNDLRFVYETSLATSRKVDTFKMLEELLGLIFGWIAPDRGCVFLCDPGSENYSIQIVKNLSVGLDSNIQVCDPIVEYVVEQKVGVLSHDPNDEIRRLNPDGRQPSISEIMCVPIQARGQLLGVFYVDTLVDASSKHVSRFTKDHLRLMLSMAHQAAVVIENENNFQSLLDKEKLAAVGETTALLSHQVNNILQGISGGRHLLELGLDKGNLELAKEGWKVVERNQARVSKMMLDLVFLSKPYEPEFKECELFGLTKDSIQRVSDSEDDSKVEFRLENSPEIQWNLDQAMFCDSIDSLLKLSRKACRRCSVDLSIDLSDAALQLNIDYVGAEIYSKPDQVQSDVSDVHDESRQFGGIEMALCQKLVLGHGGSVEIGLQPDGSNRIAIVLPRTH